MPDPNFNPEVYVAALKRERAAVAQGNYSDDRKAVQTRRLSEIDDEIRKYGGEDEAPKRRERAVNV